MTGFWNYYCKVQSVQIWKLRDNTVSFSKLWDRSVINRRPVQLAVSGDGNSSENHTHQNLLKTCRYSLHSISNVIMWSKTPLHASFGRDLAEKIKNTVGVQNADGLDLQPNTQNSYTNRLLTLTYTNW